jgi:hypothetical protein
MPRTEVYQLRLTKDEKAGLANLAKSNGISIAKLIRLRVGLSEKEPALSDEEVRSAAISSAIHAEKQALISDDRLTKLVKQLEAQGQSPAEAQERARRQLGL